MGEHADLDHLLVNAPLIGATGEMADVDSVPDFARD
jgi:hypothetical protein